VGSQMDCAVAEDDADGARVKVDLDVVSSGGGGRICVGGSVCWALELTQPRRSRACIQRATQRLSPVTECAFRVLDYSKYHFLVNFEVEGDVTV